MFRRDDYLAAGGYRIEFRVAQDHDLWFRLLRRGQLGFVTEPLFECLFSDLGISSIHADLQRELSEIAAQCHRAQSDSGDDSVWLQRAREASERKKQRKVSDIRRAQSAACYFIGTRLLAQRDRRCRDYFRRAAMTVPYSAKNWIRWLQASVTPMSARVT